MWLIVIRRINGYKEYKSVPRQNVGGNVRWTSIPSRGVAILLVASFYRKPDKLWHLWDTRLVKTFTYISLLEFRLIMLQINAIISE